MFSLLTFICHPTTNHQDIEWNKNKEGIKAEDYVVEQAKAENGEKLKTIKIKRKEIEGGYYFFK